jgi:hypothetical protein
MKKFLLVAIVLISCAKNGNVKEVSEIPAWFLEASVGTSQIYATGTGANKEEAVNSALSNAISQIKTSVSSSVRTESQITGNKLEESMQVRVSAEVERFSLGGYDITNIAFHKPSKVFYVQVVIDKFKIYNEKLAEYETKKSEIENLLEGAKGQNLVGQIEGAKKVFEASRGLRGDALILYALNKNFNLRSELGLISSFENHYKKLISKLSIEVEAPAGLKTIAENIVKNQGFRLGKGEISIKITTESTKGKVYDLFFARTLTNFEIFASGEKLKGKVFTFRATSSIGEEEAYKNSLSDFKEQFENTLLFML